jgi:DNA-binding winged helix-turn-helix (wHTH) protein
MFAETIDRCADAASFKLDDWLVEPRLNRVSNGEISVHLEPKTMAVLVCLADRAGDVVSRRELVDRVWAAEFISDSSLTHAVADLRRALEDDARAPRIIETIPKRGYRLIPQTRETTPQRETNRGSDGVAQPLAVIVGNEARLGSHIRSEDSDHHLLVGDQEIPLTRSSVVFGRGLEADIQFRVPEVSRLHARLDVGANEAVLEDLGSKNGTHVNSRRIDGALRLLSGDSIGIASTEMVYRWLSVEPTRTRDSRSVSTNPDAEQG